MSHDQWLAQVNETVIEKDQIIFDAHHHFWDDHQPAYSAEQFLEEILASGHRVEKTVFVECMTHYRIDAPKHLQSLGETQYVADATQNLTPAQNAHNQKIDIAAAIVAFIDLCQPDLFSDIIAQHQQISGGKISAIRHAVGFDEDPKIRNAHTNPNAELLLDSTFTQGVKQLAEHQLAYECSLYHLQIAELSQLAARCPQTTIILNHLGAPTGVGRFANQRERVFNQWQHDIKVLSSYDNVIVKLGGLTMSRCGFGWHKRSLPPSSAELSEAMAPYLDHTLNCFGVERCFFESNFPVDKISCSYQVLWNAFKRFTHAFSQNEKDQLYYRNAQTIYRID